MVLHKYVALFALTAIIVGGAPVAFATEDAGVSTQANVQTQNELKKDSKGSAHFEEMLLKMRAKLDKEREKIGTNTNNTRATWEKGKSVASVDASCVQKAVDTREVALQGVFSKSNASVIDALKARQTALYAAWGKTVVSERNVALKETWKTWTDTRKAISKTMKTERDTAWKTFKTTVKDSCKVAVPIEDASAGSEVAGQVTI